MRWELPGFCVAKPCKQNSRKTGKKPRRHAAKQTKMPTNTTNQKSYSKPRDFDFALWASLAEKGPSGEAELRAELPMAALEHWNFAHFAQVHFSKVFPVKPPPRSVRNFGPQAHQATDAFLAHVVELFGSEMLTRAQRQNESEPRVRWSSTSICAMMEKAGWEGLPATAAALGKSLSKQPKPIVSNYLAEIIPEMLRSAHNMENFSVFGLREPTWACVWKGLSLAHRKLAAQTPSLWSGLFESPAGAVPGSCLVTDSTQGLSIIARLGVFCEEVRPMLIERLLAPATFAKLGEILADRARRIDEFGFESEKFLATLALFESWLPIGAKGWTAMIEACDANGATSGHPCSALRAFAESAVLRGEVKRAARSSLGANAKEGGEKNSKPFVAEKRKSRKNPANSEEQRALRAQKRSATRL